MTLNDCLERHSVIEMDSLPFLGGKILGTARAHNLLSLGFEWKDRLFQGGSELFNPYPSRGRAPPHQAVSEPKG